MHSSPTDTAPPAFPPAAELRDGAIVLVHGAWVGEWCWAPLLPALASSGRSIHAVSLRGHGARSHESGPDVTLADHVADLVGLVETWDLERITLVAHSYGGRVATRALARIGRRVAHLVYLDAHAPLLDEPAPPRPDPTGQPDDRSTMIPFGEFPPDPTEFGGEEAVQWFLDRTVAQSAATLREPFTAPIDAHIDCTFVHAAGEPDSRFAPYAAAARADPAWRSIELPGSHWLMVTHPAEVAAVILDPTRVPRENESSP